MIILGIETSCDETACAVVQAGQNVLAQALASSANLHYKTGGVVPEIAARKQLEFIIPVIQDCLDQTATHFNLEKGDYLNLKSHIDAIAVTVGPGLIGSLLVGVDAAKTLALAWDKPLVGVNHLVGHLYANFINRPADEITFPAIGLVVSGGHTDFVLIHKHQALEYIGGTTDDVAGEAFDKTARLLGLATYMGGPLVSKKAAECVTELYKGRLPRPMFDTKDLDMSFSGLKTSAKNLIASVAPLTDEKITALAKEFETAVVDVLLKKTQLAVEKYGVKTILMGGGVCANKTLRTKMADYAQTKGLRLFYPALDLCTDTAVYIAGAAYFNYLPAKAYSDIQANPSLGIC